MKVITGLEQIENNENLFKGRIGLLCHNASLTSSFHFAVDILEKAFPQRLKALFGPQHGIKSDLQDNMIESDDFIHPYYQKPVFSLYGKTRVPTSEMLSHIDTLVIDLQDVGTRVYTFIWTMVLAMKACGAADKRVIILDRPNPVGGNFVEGNLLENQFSSFVGMHPLPQRHGMTMGEIAQMAQKHWGVACDLHVIKLKNWARQESEWSLPWIPPSPNIPTRESSFYFIATVIFEGTNVSEGRGSTSPFKLIGHPELDPYEFLNHFQKKYQEEFSNYALIPYFFRPTFQKHAEITCGAININMHQDRGNLWSLGQHLCHELMLYLGESFSWKQPPYEYEYTKLPIDLINGSEQLRHLYTQNDFSLELAKCTQCHSFLDQRDANLLYK